MKYVEINKRYRQTYITFHRIDKNTWKFDGCCFRGETRNRRIRKTQLERCIEEMQKAGRMEDRLA